MKLVFAPLFLCVVLASAIGASWQSETTQPASSLPASTKWESRLTALNPLEPMGYFELAEEVADEATTTEDRALARHLFGLAATLRSESLARSACLALADLEADEQERRRLRALAMLMGGQGEFAVHSGTEEEHASRFERFSSATVLAVTEAISRYRKGNGAQAAAALRKGEADQLLRACDRLLPGGYNRFIEDIKQYRGQAKPTLSANDQLRLLQLEAALLAGSDRSWSSELLVSNGLPLIEVDPGRLAETLNVDPTRSKYAAGRWVRP